MTQAVHPHEVLLVWKNPRTRQRYLIGRLWKSTQGFHFSYVHDQLRSLRAAISDGFAMLEAFPDQDREYVSERLFPTFAHRAFAPWRAKEVEALVGFRCDTPDEEAFEYLRATGGRLPTDTLEFLEPSHLEKDSLRLTFPVAGWRYYAGEAAIGELPVGTRVSLSIEPGNKYDASAIRVSSPSGKHIGYVPAIYSWYLDEAVSLGAYAAKVRRVGGAGDPEMRVTITMTAQRDRYSGVPKRFEAYAQAMLGG